MSKKKVPVEAPAETEELTTPEETSADESGSGLSRRRLLTAAAASAAGAVVLPAASCASPAPKSHSASGKLAALPEICSFPEPKPVYPVNGVTRPDPLNVDFKRIASCTGTGTVRSYNNLTPGPTLFVDPGGSLEFTLYNRLPENPAPSDGIDKCHEKDNMNQPHCFNTTNMHFHGLHVSPCSKWRDTIPNCDPYDKDGKKHEGQPMVASDDVLFEVKPKDEGGKPQPYCVEIPPFHAPGTHWYHSHKHGSTAIQVANGLAGALIVRENNPDLIKVLPPQDRDYVWIIQEVLPNNEDWKIYPQAGGPPQSKLLINGECAPCLPAKTGQNLRLRFINATGTPRGFTRLQLVKDPNNAADETVPPLNTDKKMYLMAVDGITFFGHKPQPVGIPTGGARWWDLSPGNRSDMLVQFSPEETGVWKIVKLDVPNVNVTTGPQVLGCIEVTKGAYSDPDPATIQLGSWKDAPAYLQPIEQSEICEWQRGSANKTVTFTVNPQGANGFKIGYKNNRNGDGWAPQHYSSDSYVQTYLGCVEEWELLNTAVSQGAAQPHPFHVHVNPFQIVSVSGGVAAGAQPDDVIKIDLNKPNTPENRIWWDTIAIPPQTTSGTNVTPGRVVQWTRFWDYPGTFVIHCHVLVHEDIGMMANVWVQDPKNQGFGPCEKVTGPAVPHCQNPKCSW